MTSCFHAAAATLNSTACNFGIARATLRRLTQRKDPFMPKLKLSFCAIVFCAGMVGHAQTQEQGLWLNVDYTYTDFSYKETGVAEKGHAPGVRGEFGFSLLRGLSVSAGGEYMDGNLSYDGETAIGSSVNVINKDYMRDLRAMAHLAYGSFILSGGIAQRYWYDDLVGS